MKLQDWFRSQSRLVQALVVLAVVVVLAVATAGALVGTAVVGTFVLPAGEPVGSDHPTPMATPMETDTPGSMGTAEGTPPQSPPQVQFSLSSADDGATITHVGGDSIRAGWLQVNVDGQPRGTWASNDDAHEPSDEVTEGASITVTEVSSGDVIELVWTPPDRDPMPVARLSAP